MCRCIRFNLGQTIMWKNLLQKVALENEQGISDNPLKISWLEVPTSATDEANSETVPEVSNSAREAMVESKVTLTVMPTLPLLAGDLRFFALSPVLPLWYINLPVFTSTINIEYLVKNKTDLV